MAENSFGRLFYSVTQFQFVFIDRRFGIIEINRNKTYLELCLKKNNNNNNKMNKYDSRQNHHRIQMKNI